MAVPRDTDKRKCDALLAFSSWTLRTRSACLRIFNTPLENALFDHMLPSSPPGAPFSFMVVLILWVSRKACIWIAISYRLSSSSFDFYSAWTSYYSQERVGLFVLNFSKSHQDRPAMWISYEHTSRSRCADSINTVDIGVNFIKVTWGFPVFICINKAHTGEVLVCTHLLIVCHYTNTKMHTVLRQNMP